MSRDWLIAAIAAGHLGVVVYFTNVLHALGLSKARMELLKCAFVAVVIGVTTVMALAVARDPWERWPIGVRAYAVVCVGMCLAGIPISSLLLHLRRSPEGVSERSTEIDLATLHGAGTLVGDGRNSWLLKLRGNESLRLRKREWDVPLAALPREWDGLSLVQLTDLHFAPAYRRRFFELVADQAGAWEADLVVFTGDLVDHDAVLEWIVPVMSRVRGRLGSFAILGNHDYNHDHLRVRRLLEEAGYTDLEGAWTRLDVEGRSLAIGGTSFPWGPRLDLDAAAGADFRLLLSHSPDLFYRAADAGIDLMLSGHNHAGQIRLPGLGPIFMPSLYSRRFDRGYFRSGGTLLHVGEGVGGLHPLRYGCVPEISRLRLRAHADPHPSRPSIQRSFTSTDR